MSSYLGDKEHPKPQRFSIKATLDKVGSKVSPFSSTHLLAKDTYLPLIFLCISGDDLPVTKFYFQMVETLDKTAVYAIGGYGSNNKEIYKYSCSGDIKTCKWTKSNTVLKYGRDRLVAIPIPNSLADKLCN